MKQILLIFLFNLFALPAMSTEQPQFEIIEQHDDYHLRRYAPMIIAQVEVTGDMGDASSKGFRILADYIFGNNVVVAANDLATQVSKAESTKIEMTAPVSRTSTGDNKWLVSFVMPSKWTINTLPKPNNPDIEIIEIAEHKVAVIQFSGLGRESTFTKKHAELSDWLADNDYAVIGEARYAAYNPPWTLPPFRRNEVIIPVALD